ncbi:hypothetical protein J1G42_08480 [Cellulomonas sp. zg-ZUI222]|uniref:hypothetical protein n=1 Tax=Cellulomonas TaxID=1707 RepID=UPI001A94F9FA|nr:MULTISPECIES: hypothetical protein [Cellulomonas]MBO0900224.1 hypothetical protein [Cellulomonas sp. zg-ZUI22]MBO0920862.1 hypothetical protein [Cellulomonas wangleii]
MSHDPSASVPDPTTAPPDAVLSPDGTQWYDSRSASWVPVPVPGPAPRDLKPLLVPAGLALAAGLCFWLPALVAGDQRLADAHDRCGAGVLGDGGRSLRLDGRGALTHSGEVTEDDMRCVALGVELPDRTWTAMLGTTPEQGRQVESWDGIEASWTHDPDLGLDVVLELE